MEYGCLSCISSSYNTDKPLWELKWRDVLSTRILHLSTGVNRAFSTALTLIIKNFDAHYPLEAPQPHVPGNKENLLVHQISSELDILNDPNHQSNSTNFSLDISLAPV